MPEARFALPTSQGVLANIVKGLLYSVVLVPIFVVLGAAYWIYKGPGAEITLPLVMIGGVLVLLVSLATIALLYAAVGIDNKEQALALPEGSVRAVIALSLVLLFSVMAVFLYNSVANGGKIRTLPDLTADAAKEFSNKFPGVVVFIQPPLPTAPKTAQPNDKFTVFYVDRHSAAGDDLAKQLIVLLGTLVTAVASFYFGTKATAASGATPSTQGSSLPYAAPKVTAFTSTLKNNNTAQDFTLDGNNLASIKEVTLEMANQAPIAASIIQSNARHVTCKLTIDSNKPPGAWDVVVSDGTTKTTIGKVQIGP